MNLRPDHKEIKYRFNPETGRYQKMPSKIAFQKLPFELKIEVTQDVKIQSQGAEFVLTGRFVNNKREFFTGLRNTNSLLCYSGNDYELVKGKKVLSLIIAKLSQDDEFLTIYYFNRFYPHVPSTCDALIDSIIREIE